MIKKKFLPLLCACLVSSPVLADGLVFKARLTGAEEVPVPVVTATTAKARFKVNGDETAIDYSIRIRNAERILAGPGGHIHCAPAGVNGPVVAFVAGGLPVGLNGDVTIKGTLDDGNIINDACGATVTELVDSFIDGATYVNLHSAANPGGEVRGQIEPAAWGRDDD